MDESGAAVRGTGDDESLEPVMVFGDDPRIAALASYTDHLDDLVQVYSDAAAADRLDAVPAPDRWSVAQVVHHLADAELVASVRLRRLLVEGATEAPGWDPQEWSRVLQYDVRPPEDALTVLLALRQANARLLASLPAATWAPATDGAADLSTFVADSVEHLRQKVFEARLSGLGLL